jgi:AraC-like DNA-binding protein
MPASDQLIRSASLTGYVTLVRELGHDPHPLLRGVGLSARLLDNPETLIPSYAVRELLERTRVTGAENFALRLAAQRTFSNLGPISLVLKDEPTPASAGHPVPLSQAAELRAGDPHRRRRLHGAGARRPAAGSRRGVDPAVDRAGRGGQVPHPAELIGPQWRPLQVCFTHRAPVDASVHRAFFGRMPMFNQGFNGMVCALADMQLSRVPDNTGVVRFARDYLEAALHRRHADAQATCRELITALLPGGRCTAQQMARHLGMDRRTLHRHLSAEGHTFSALLDEVRAGLVLRHLRESDLPLGEVAGLLGFSGPSSFSHWFRSTFGTSVSGWRRQQSTAAEHAAHGEPRPG